MILTGHFNALLFIRGIYRVFEQVPDQISNSHKIRILIRQIEGRSEPNFFRTTLQFEDIFFCPELVRHPVVLC